MPAKCCVPECRSNYSSILRDEPYTSVFRFPSESHRPGVRQKWIQFINRKGWVPTKRSVVCIKHFHKEDIISCDKFADADGVEQTIQRRCPVLKPYACPAIPPPLPPWLTRAPVVLRKEPPNIPAAGIKQEHDSDVVGCLKSDLSSDSSDFTVFTTVMLYIRRTVHVIYRSVRLYHTEPLYHIHNSYIMYKTGNTLQKS